MNRNLLALVAVCVLHLLGCSTKKAESGPLRIVSLTPPITETLFAIGAGDSVVGVTDFCDYPAEAKTRRHVGSILQPNYEEIVRLKPTLILGEPVQTAPVDKLNVIAQARMLPWLSMEEVEASTRELGKLTHREALAEAIVKQLEARMKPTATPESPRVLLAIAGGAGPFSEIWYVKRNSLHGTALEAAGARNAIAENVTGAPVLSLERVIALDPDAVVLLVSMDGLDESTRKQYVDAWNALPTLRAVKNKKIFVLSGTDVQATGPRIIQLTDRMAALVKSIGASQ